jgi:hypothetical protein
MLSRSDIQRQISQIVSTVNAQGLKFEDVIPDEMRIHFQEMVALKEAHAYIKEMEVREKELETSNAGLLTQLETKQAEIDEQPEELRALKVDLQQSRNHIKYYQGLADYHEASAERSQRKLTEACRAQKIAANDADKIEALERNVAERDIVIYKLVKENRAMVETHEAEHEENLAVIGEKDAVIFALTNRVNQTEAEKIMADENSEQVADTCNSLVENIEQEAMTAAEVVNSKSIKLFEMRESHDRLCSAIASELTPLNRLYDHIYGIMKVYRSIFQGLLDPRTHVVPHIPQSLDSMLDAANDELYAYQQVSDEIHSQSLVQKHDSAHQKVVQQVDNIAKAAARTCTNVEELRDDVSKFLDRLRNNPDTRLNTKPQCGSAALSPVEFGHSPRSGISSLVSFTKRFSTSSSSSMKS